MRKRIVRLVAMEPDRWHQLTMSMAWVYRIGKAPPPSILAVFDGRTPTKEEWAHLRKEVNAARKSDRASTRRYELARRADERRSYMRNYMRKYRAEQRTQP